MIESVIPPDRQSSSLQNEIAAIFKDVPKDRMILRLGTELNPKFNLDSIMAENVDAAFIGMGLPESAGGELTQTPCQGLWNALDFLVAAKQPDKINLSGKSVAVIGGGNTAMDAAVTAARLGAKDVYVIYRRSFVEMPAWPAERSRAMDEGVHFLILTAPVAINSKDGKLTGIKVCPTTLGPPDSSGRRRPQPMTSGAYDLSMDIVIEAISQKAAPDIGKILPGIELQNGLIKTKPGSFRTSRPKVFAGGDLVRGPSTVVAAVADGMAAAKEISESLK
jgi:NADPH-dependent glutamate synthase beta subunit-like oxidoreductase